MKNAIFNCIYNNLGGKIESILSRIPPNREFKFYSCAAIVDSSSNPTLSLPSSSTFPNLSDQSDAYRIKEPEIYDNYNGDVAESYINSLRRLMGH